MNPEQQPINQQPQTNKQDVPKPLDQASTQDTVLATPLQPTPNAQQHSRKKLVLIAAVTIVGLALIAFAIFSLWYNKPENAVADSFMKLVTARTSEGSGSVVLPSGESSNKIAFSYAQNEANEASGTVGVTSSGSDSTIDIKAAFAVDKDQTVYVKVDNLRKILESLAGTDPSASMYTEMFSGVVDSVEGKWISISQEDLQKLGGSQSGDKELSCVEDKIVEFQGSKSQQNEVKNLYTKHPFIDVTQVGTETVEGVYSNKYQLKPNEANGQEFQKGLVALTVFKNIDGCVSDDLAKEINESSKDTDSSSQSTDTVEYWVGVWSHEPVKLHVKSTESGETTTFEFKPRLNTNPSVTIPKADKSIIELQEEITKATSELYSGMTEPMPLDDL